MYYAYIMASKRNGTLYIGVTNNIYRRACEHKLGRNKGSFSYKYGTFILVYYEEFKYIDDAIHREKCLKNWSRLWKLKLIEQCNPDWRDLYEDFIL